MRSRRDLRFCACGSVAIASALLACGSRTDLGPAPPSSDAGLVTDAPSEADAARCCDVGDGASPPDAATPVDAGKGCNDGGPIEVSYVFDAVGVLYRYDPLTARTTRLGAPSCGNGSVPWTMTASRKNAYVVYTDWSLYAVDLVTLACSPTAFRPGQLGLETEFGVAVSGSGASERLFVYGEPRGGAPILAVTDLGSFVLTKVGDILPAPPAPSFPVNLTADATGHLYAFSPGGLLQKIDSATGAVLDAAQTGITTGGTWASFTLGSEVFLAVGSRVDGYDLASRRQTSTHDLGVFPIGAGTVLACPGQ
jgi:hypothetical protein